MLLDGLDEVTTAGQRAFVREAVLAFNKRFPGNHTLVTCRVLAYQPPEPGKEDLRLDRAEFPAYELAPVVRRETLNEFPDIAGHLNALASKLTTPAMTRLNAQVEYAGDSLTDVAVEFLESAGLP